MAVLSYEVPEQFAGKSLAQLRKERQDPFRADLLAGMLGVDQNAPLTLGQSFNISGDPGSAEVQFLRNTFAPAGTRAQAEAQTEAERLNQLSRDFVSEFGETFPRIVSEAEAAENLPTLRDIAYQSTDLLEQTPERQAQATQGFDVTQNQLDRIVAADVAELSPIAQRDVQNAQRAGELVNQRIQQALVPLQMKADSISQEVGRGFQLLTQNIQNDLQRDLQELQSLNAIELQRLSNEGQLQRLIKQAEIEDSMIKNSGQLINLGDRIGWIVNGQELTSVPIGLSPTRGGGSSLGSLAEQQALLSGSDFGYEDTGAGGGSGSIKIVD